MIVVGTQTDAAARGDFIPGLSLEVGVENDLALGLRQVIHVRVQDVMKPLQVVLVARHRGRGRVVPALVVPCEDGVQRTIPIITCGTTTGYSLTVPKMTTDLTYSGLDLVG